jgi:hypothetical protein
MSVFSSLVYYDNSKLEHIFKQQRAIILNPLILSCRQRNNSNANRGRYLYKCLLIISEMNSLSFVKCDYPKVDKRGHNLNVGYENIRKY